MPRRNDARAPPSLGMLGLVVGIAVIAALGGLLVGYDTGIIGVALLGLGRPFRTARSSSARCSAASGRARFPTGWVVDAW